MNWREVGPEHRTPPRQLFSRVEDSVTGQLRAGKTLFTETTDWNKTGNWRTRLKQQGYRLHSRKKVIDGVEGLVMWAEKIDESP